MSDAGSVAAASQPEASFFGNEDAASVASSATDMLFPRPPSVYEPDTEAKLHQLGLHINHPWGWSGSGYDDYDVITVHGIRDDYKTAWTTSDGTWWVKEQLFDSLTVREVDFSYKIDEASTLYQDQGITLLAEQLLADYADVRAKLDETETDRPIVWICHDLGGTIVKRALVLAMADPEKYGKIAILSSAIFFLGVPHRFETLDDARDQIHCLLRLPGPEIRKKLVQKVHHLAQQVDLTNQLFLATKIFDRAVIFNIFSHNVVNSLREDPVIDDPALVKELIGESPSDPVAPFSRNTHFVGHSFETAGRMPWQEIDHRDLIRGDPGDYWVSAISNMLPKAGSVIKVSYRFLPIQAWLLALSPPTRCLRIPFDPARPTDQLITWITTQTPYTPFGKAESGISLLHLHGNGTPLLDVPDFSRQFYAWLASETNGVVGPDRKPEWSSVYFEFDAQDSRYNDISSMLICFINTLVWRFWDTSETLATKKLAFLADVRAWSLDDLYDVFTSIRRCNWYMPHLTFFINSLDQCPEHQRQWFLNRVFEETNESDGEFRLILTSQARDGLAFDFFPEGARINLAECPALPEQQETKIKHIDSVLDAFVADRPIYKELESQIREILHSSDDTPYLAQIAMTWLMSRPRGVAKVGVVAQNIGLLSPLTPERLVQLVVSSLPSESQTRAKTAFNWIKHAAEPWSPESLAEALCIYESSDSEPHLEDVDMEGITRAIEEAFMGIITTKDRDVRFSHPSFYQVAELGIDEELENTAAKVHSQITETCLQYFTLPVGRKILARLSPERLRGGPWASLLDATPISHDRNNMAEYAARFWPYHYKASGCYKPKQLVHSLLTDNESRASWEVPSWLLSNPFTRARQTYLGTLPILARLGLDDLIEAQIQADAEKPLFAKDCWFAIVEAAYTSNETLVRRLIGLVAVDEYMLGAAISGAVAVGNTGIADALVGVIPNLEAFEWPENAFTQATACGMDVLLAAMMRSGRDINKTDTYGSSLVSTACWRHQISTVKFLLGLDPRPDLTTQGDEDDTALTDAIIKGDTAIVKVLVAAGADIHAKPTSDDDYPAMRAVKWRKHNVLRVFLEAGVDVYGGKIVERKDNHNEGQAETDDSATTPIDSDESLLHEAAARGGPECIRVLAENGFDLNAPSNSGTALHIAVHNGHANVVKVLLELGVKAQWDHAPAGQETALMRAINEKDTQIVSLLLENGAKVDYVEPVSSYLYAKTPLARACAMGNLALAKLLLEHHADINYTGDGEPDGDISDPPLFTAIWEYNLAVAEHLLKDETADVKWAGASDQLGPIHAAFNKMTILPTLLERGAPINARSIQGTVLHMAARANSHETIEYLLKHDPKPELECALGDEHPDDTVHKDEMAYTPLQVACANAAAESVKALLDAGADAKSRNERGIDALDALLLADDATDAATECIHLLVRWPYSVPVDQVDGQGQTRLHHIQSNTPISTIQTLIEYGSPIDRKNREGYTPLAIAISRDNDVVAEYLFKRGASMDVYGPKFGSILHLAVKHGMMPLVKLMIKSGADLERVDPEYGESLVYTALTMNNGFQITEMVQYLVGEAKAPVHKLGGRFGYPIVLAASLFSGWSPLNPPPEILKYLIRHGAQVEAADKYGRRPLHFACRSQTSTTAMEILLKAGATLDAADNLGRKPIHYAAMSFNSINYLCDQDPALDVNVTDNDGWTPLLWAARSGSYGPVERLIGMGADLWVRGRVSGTEEWSALKLSRFSNLLAETRQMLRPAEQSRVKSDGTTEDWDDDEHRSGVGHNKGDTCTSCLDPIRGIQWKCIECSEDFSLCFKCYRHRSEIHDPAHSFEEIEPLFDSATYSVSNRSSGSEQGEGEPRGGSVGSFRDGEGQTSESDMESMFDPDA